MSRSAPLARLRAALALSLLAPAAHALAAPPGSPWGAGYFPDVELVSHDGERVRFYSDLVRDRRVVVSFVYTRCTKICGLVTANLARVQRELGDRVGKEVFLYSISLDPERDTPAALAAYAAAFKARPGWRFLTGRKADIELLRRKLGDVAPVEDHAPRLAIGNDRTGQWWTTTALDDPRYLATVIGSWMDPAFDGRAAVATRDYARAPAAPPASGGAALFRQRCASCHVAGGDSVGPDLRGAFARRGEAWLRRWLRSPAELIRARDPIALELLARHGGVPMPEPRLTGAELEEVLGHLRATDAAAEIPAPALHAPSMDTDGTFEPSVESPRAGATGAVSPRARHTGAESVRHATVRESESQ